MKTLQRLLVLPAVTLGVIVAVAPAASAQTGSPRPLRPATNGLYGDPDHSVDMFLSLVEAYDDNLLAQEGNLDPASPTVGGFYTMFGADGAYEWKGQRTQFGATGASVVRYYGDAQKFITSLSAGIGLSTTLGRRTTLSANQSFAYSPSYLTGLFPGVVTPEPGASPPIGADFTVHDASSYMYETKLGITQGLTRRGTLSATVDHRYTDFIRESASAGWADQALTQARVEFARGISRNVSLRVAYRYQYGDLSSGLTGLTPGTKGIEHGADVGLDYVRPLSATRRLMFSFGLGSGAADFPSSGITGDQLHYRALGDASVAYQFRRTWETRASYRRGLEYVPELTGPVYTDGLSAALTGFFTPRLDLAAAIGYSTGASAIGQSVPAYDTVTANLRVRRSLTRRLAVYVAYVYYRYDFGSSAQLQPGLPTSMARNGVRLGLSLWLPAVRR